MTNIYASDILDELKTKQRVRVGESINNKGIDYLCVENHEHYGYFMKDFLNGKWCVLERTKCDHDKKCIEI